MSQQNPNKEDYREDEIDLRKLFQAIGNGFANIGAALINLIVRIRRVSITYKKLIITMIVLGVVAGVAFNIVSKPYYNTSMLLSSEYFNGRLVENNIEKLNTLCKEEDRVGLAKVLNIEEQIAKNIKEFAFDPMVSEQDIVDVEVLKQKLEELKVKDPDIAKVIEQIEIRNKKTYIITVQVFDNTIIGNLQESLVQYFRNSPFVKNRIDINRTNQLKLIGTLQNDLAQLDSLKYLFNQNLKATAGRKGETSSLYIGESGALDPIRFYSQSIRLYEKLQEAQQQVELGDDFEVIDGFTVFSRPESPGLIKATIFSLLIFIGLAYIIVILIEINKYLNEVEKERFEELEEN